MSADDLLPGLVAGLTPVRRAPRPASCLALWLAVSLPVLAVIVAWFGLRPDLAARLASPAFLAEQVAALLTALLAGYAAICAGRPDQPDWKSLVAAAACVLWLATLGRQCLAAWITLGPAGLALQQDAMCLPAIAMGALVPALAIVLLLRRGTVVRRLRACLLGALAAAALADVALRFYHAEDAALTVLVWQFGSVALLSLVLAAVARAALPRVPSMPPPAMSP